MITKKMWGLKEAAAAKNGQIGLAREANVRSKTPTVALATDPAGLYKIAQRE